MRYLGVTPPPIRGPRWTLQSRVGEVEGGEEETESEGTGVGRDTPESLEACSQELFSSQEEGNQSQQPVLGEGQTEEWVPATLRSRLPALSTAQRLQNLWKKPRKSKEDMLQAAMDHSVTENQKVQDWRERESRIRQKNPADRKKRTKQLISILARQMDSIQALVAMQAEHYRAAHPPVPKLFPLCPKVSSKPHSPASRILPPPAASNTCRFTNHP
ncbi:uncharacterized protein LOC127044425 [Gopherus flavomarginatus]|uniref:uncharacterized protein LOC127044425 n=1 Tax=Gopherus flavomarginatus TaxID=286002 RepID=UPI0021CC4AC3|nr:uncharacterized protein LOC127044425 [Gopherus flavomarginatus]